MRHTRGTTSLAGLRLWLRCRRAPVVVPLVVVCLLSALVTQGSVISLPALVMTHTTLPVSALPATGLVALLLFSGEMHLDPESRAARPLRLYLWLWWALNLALVIVPCMAMSAHGAVIARNCLALFGLALIASALFGSLVGACLPIGYLMVVGVLGNLGRRGWHDPPRWWAFVLDLEPTRTGPWAVAIACLAMGVLLTTVLSSPAGLWRRRPTA